MTSITVGLIPAPGLPADIAGHLKEELPNVLRDYIDKDVSWLTEITVDSLTGAAEDIDELLHKATIMKKQQQWDYAICLTDLPVFANKHLVTADASVKNGVAQISLPSFGFMPTRQRIRKAITQMVAELYYRSSTSDSFPEESLERKLMLNENDGITNILKQQFSLAATKRISPPGNSKQADIRFILKSRFIGKVRVISGMTFANRPWTALFSFKQVLTLAFATGAYISIFPTPWQLSINYSLTRLIVLTLIAVLGMVVWVIFSNNLWEKSTSNWKRKLSRLYNYTTITTLTMIVSINYIALFVFFLIGVAIFIPPDLFKAWTGLDEEVSIGYYFRLVWLITSLGTIAGAIGTGVENEDKIRDITYSYRHKQRNYQIQKEREDYEKEVERQ